MSNKNEMTGRLIVLNETKTFSSGFSKREFVIEESEGKFPQTIKFEIVKDNIEKLEPFKIGDEITVHYNVRGNEYNGKYYVNLVAWRLERAEPSSNDPGDNYREKAGQVSRPVSDDGDLPPF